MLDPEIFLTPLWEHQRNGQCFYLCEFVCGSLNSLIVQTLFHNQATSTQKVSHQCEHEDDWPTCILPWKVCAPLDTLASNKRGRSALVLPHDPMSNGWPCHWEKVKLSDKLCPFPCSPTHMSSLCIYSCLCNGRKGSSFHSCRIHTCYYGNHNPHQSWYPRKTGRDHGSGWGETLNGRRRRGSWACGQGSASAPEPRRGLDVTCRRWVRIQDNLRCWQLSLGLSSWLLQQS